MLINRVALAFLHLSTLFPADPEDALLWSTDKWERRKWMNAWWMEMGRAFAAVGKRSDWRWKEEEESERMWEGGGGGRRGIPGILLLRESSLACVLLSPTLFHTGTHTHRHTLSLQCKEAEQTYVRRCFQCQLILPPPRPECDIHCPGRKWKAVSISIAVSCRVVALSRACDY